MTSRYDETFLTTTQKPKKRKERRSSFSLTCCSVGCPMSEINYVFETLSMPEGTANEEDETTVLHASLLLAKVLP